MILYFSGTGNSAFIAKQMAAKLDDECLDLFERIRDQDASRIHSDTPWIITVPTYAWRIPRIVEEWLMKSELSGNQNIYFIMTCGGSIGNASKWLKKTCLRLGMTYHGCAQILMPENYIALYEAPDEGEAHAIIAESLTQLNEITRRIKEGQDLDESAVNVMDRVRSGLINPLFYPLMVKPNKFYVKENCNSCGKCVAVCPMKNIRLQEGHPIWGTSCTHCMACICRCPMEAIEYGNHTKGLRRYTCPVEE